MGKKGIETLVGLFVLLGIVGLVFLALKAANLASFGGGEANVAASLANFGLPVEFVTRLPANDLGDACVQFMRGYGIGTSRIVRGGERLGIYFLEMGAMQRGSKVVYDRAYSSIATIEPGMIDWQSVFADADWFHWTGITPAVSQGAAEVCREASSPPANWASLFPPT